MLSKIITNKKEQTIDEKNREHYFNNLCIEPHHSNYNDYDNDCCVQSTKPACENEIECSTESEDSVQ